MKKILDPMKTILQLYCHVECYEVHEIASDMIQPSWKIDVLMLKKQLEEIFQNPNEYINEINEITANEFESCEELKELLVDILDQINK